MSRLNQRSLCCDLTRRMWRSSQNSGFTRQSTALTESLKNLNDAIVSDCLPAIQTGLSLTDVKTLCMKCSS